MGHCGQVCGILGVCAYAKRDKFVICPAVILGQVAFVPSFVVVMIYNRDTKKHNIEKRKEKKKRRRLLSNQTTNFLLSKNGEQVTHLKRSFTSGGTNAYFVTLLLSFSVFRWDKCKLVPFYGFSNSIPRLLHNSL